ncbi:MAG: hypothetical protein ACI9BD_001356 [Candidatus Marinamargulisbacteria bacterium]|jgi:hypothetical protein
MIITTDDYQIECIEEGKAVLKGTMRLPSPTSYEQPFEPIKAGIEIQKDEYTIDITDLNYLNSSGLTAFARLFILARSKKIPLKIVGRASVPWQKTSIRSLQKLWDEISIELT